MPKYLSSASAYMNINCNIKCERDSQQIIQIRNGVTSRENYVTFKLLHIDYIHL